MVKRSFIPLVIALAAVATMAGACSSSKSSSSAAATTVPSGDKTKFCADNQRLTDDFNKATAQTDILGIIKQDASVIADFGATAPADIKADAQVLVDAANSAETTNDINKLNTAAVQAAGPKIDTYCGQNTTSTTQAASTGGDKAALCAIDTQVNATIAAHATDGPGLLAALKAIQTTIDGAVQLAPADLTADVQVLVSATDAAIAANDASKLQTTAVQTSGAKLDSYCGVGAGTATTAPPTTA